jgi:exodeoxyribonuclease VII large subunit
LIYRERKKIPEYVRKIAVITAENGAAVRDFVTVMSRRSLEYKITIIPSVVQGDQASASLMAAIDRVEQLASFDVVVITRGGGSQEDLWCFNDENLVRRIATMKIPTISAIGHEVDFTLCDFVADLRCETPTAAAEVLSSKQLKMQQQLQFAFKQIQAFGLRKKQYLQYLQDSLKPGSQIKFLQNLLLVKHRQLTKTIPRAEILEKRIYKIQVNLEQSIERVSNLSNSLVKDKFNIIDRDLFST